LGKSEVVGSIYKILSLPFLIIAEMLVKFGPESFKWKYSACEKAIRDSEAYDYDLLLYKSVISAEDHRFNYHYGLDFYSIVRAIVRTCQGNTEGGSTIEQQFVRTVTLRYERTLLRKISEQLLSVSLSRKYHKKDILKAYISIACYGHDYVGVKGVQLLIKKHSNLSPMNVAISIAARLKYPEPSVPSEIWRRKYDARVVYLQQKA